MKNQRIIIVDDEPIVLKSLKDLLSNNYKILFFTSAEEFLAASSNFDFEDGVSTCILLDLQMPGMNGIELQKNLKQMNIEFPIIFMSGNAHTNEIIESWRGGAIDFILKPFTASEITTILTTQFEILEQQNLRTPANKQTIENIAITKREAQVLLLLGAGHQQSEIAEMLSISLRTVKMYRANLKDKLYLNSLMELGRYCDHNAAIIKKIAGD